MAGKVARPGGSAGLPADALGNPAIDPTENVKALTEAEARRQDDLRAMESGHIREILLMTERLTSVNAACAKEIADLRDRHNQEMRKSEADRLDAIREVDVQAVQRAAEVQLAQATALATQVSVSAETLRAQVSSAATVQATALATALAPLTEAIADLRRSQYELQGQRAGVTETTTDRRASTGLLVGIAVGIATYLTLIIGVVVAITQ